jgi:serine/threonine-protein kinase
LHLTAASPTGISPRPAPARTRRMLTIGAAAVVVTGLIVGGAVALWPSDKSSAPGDTSAAAPSGATANAPQGRPATDVQPQALRPILLSAEQINQAAGGDQLIIDVDKNELLNDSAQVGAEPCIAAWAPAQQSAYAETGYTGVAVQELRALNAGVWQDGVVQAAIALPSIMQVSGFMQNQVRAWTACAGQGPVTITPPSGAPAPWTFTAPVTTAGIVTSTATAPDGQGSCQRGLVARGNVVIDIRQCRPEGGLDVTALVRATGEQVPRG